MVATPVLPPFIICAGGAPRGAGGNPGGAPIGGLGT
jgi:hypothetical protein